MTKPLTVEEMLALPFPEDSPQQCEITGKSGSFTVWLLPNDSRSLQQKIRAAADAHKKYCLSQDVVLKDANGKERKVKVDQDTATLCAELAHRVLADDNGKPGGLLGGDPSQGFMFWVGVCERDNLLVDSATARLNAMDYAPEILEALKKSLLDVGFMDSPESTLTTTPAEDSTPA